MILLIIKYEPYYMANMIYSIYYGGNYIPSDKMAPLYNFISLLFLQKRFLLVLSAEMLLEKIVFDHFRFEITELVVLMMNCNYLLLKIIEAVVFINDGYIGNTSKKNLAKIPNFTRYV